MTEGPIAARDRQISAAFFLALASPATSLPPGQHTAHRNTYAAMCIRIYVMYSWILTAKTGETQMNTIKKTTWYREGKEPFNTMLNVKVTTKDADAMKRMAQRLGVDLVDLLRASIKTWVEADQVATILNEATDTQASHTARENRDRGGTQPNTEPGHNSPVAPPATIRTRPA